MEIIQAEEDKLLIAAQEIAPWLHGELVYNLDSIDKGYYTNLISRNIFLICSAQNRTCVGGHGRFGEVYQGKIVMRGNINHEVNFIHSYDVKKMLEEAEILAKMNGAYYNPDETEHHENVRNFFGLVFNDPITEVLVISYVIEKEKAIFQFRNMSYFIRFIWSSNFVQMEVSFNI